MVDKYGSLLWQDNIVEGVVELTHQEQVVADNQYRHFVEKFESRLAGQSVGPHSQNPKTPTYEILFIYH